MIKKLLINLQKKTNQVKIKYYYFIIKNAQSPAINHFSHNLVKNNQKISTNASTEFPKELLTDSSNFSNNPINSVLRKESKNFKSKSILLPETITKPADYMSNILPKKEVPAEEKKNKTSLEESGNNFYEKMMKNFNKADSKTKHNKSKKLFSK